MSFLGNLFGGGGGGGGAKTIDPAVEYSKMLNVFQNQAYPAYQKFAAGLPWAQQAMNLANQQYGNLPGYQQNYSRYYNQAQGQLAPLYGMVQNAYQSAVPNQQLTGPLMMALNRDVTPILQNQGALTPDLARYYAQQGGQLATQAGMGHTSQFPTLALLNSEQARQNRLNTAIGQAQGLTSGVSGLDTAALSRAMGGASSLAGLAQSPMQLSQQFATGQMGLSDAVSKMLYGAGMAPIGAWGSLFNPTGQNVADVLNYNLNAQNAANIAGANNQAAILSGLLRAVGSVAGSYLGS